MGAGMLDVGQGLNQSKDVPAWGMGEEGILRPGTDSLIALQTGGITLLFAREIINSQRVLN